jgi:RNA polymerase sigma-70 factor (ECF subfamily)
MKDVRSKGATTGPTRLGDPSAATPHRKAAPLDFATLYDAWFDHVARWLHALGAPSADTEDLAQEVFLVVRRRLSDFDGRNVAGWLYRIASGQVRQHRRRRWFQKMLSFRQAPDLDEVPDPRANAVTMLETKDKQLLLESLLAKMSEKRRMVFALFEVEGYGGDEIADILDVPINTVWTRLHHARKDFFSLLAEHRRTRSGDG